LQVLCQEKPIEQRGNRSYRAAGPVKLTRRDRAWEVAPGEPSEQHSCPAPAVHPHSGRYKVLALHYKLYNASYIVKKRLARPAVRGLLGRGVCLHEHSRACSCLRLLAMHLYDYIIVGGGSAGCVLAARLSELPDARVLLLEAGPSDSDWNIHLPAAVYRTFAGPLTWGYKTAPLRQANNRQMIYPVARVLGGGSSINAMVYTRGSRHDYDAWAQEDRCAGWSYSDVLPYFVRAENNERYVNEFHGFGGPLSVSDQISPHVLSRAFVRAAQQAGLPYNPDFNGERQEGAGLYQVTQCRARRCSSSVAYLCSARHRENLHILTGRQAVRICFEGRRAIGIEYLQEGSRHIEFARAEREIIVSAGTIGSPKLLLLSGIGPADELKSHGIKPLHDLPGVGRNFQDHVDLCVISELSGPYGYDRHNRLPGMLWSALEYFLFGTGPVTSNVAEGGGFWYTNRAKTPPDIQFHFVPSSSLKGPVPGLKGYGCTLNSCYLRPSSRGTVKLSGSDPLAAPLVDPNYWADFEDLRRSVEAFKRAREIMAQPALRPYIKREHLPGNACRTDKEIIQYAREYGKTDFHPVGTCKMGADESAVVDPNLRVRGLESLRIIDASIMPQLISSNTNAATIMIGEKGSDLVKYAERNRSSDAARASLAGAASH
jgi:choline dehydrogenase